MNICVDCFIPCLYIDCKDFQNEEGKHLTVLSEIELYEKRAAEKLKMKQEKEIEELANKIKAGKFKLKNEANYCHLLQYITNINLK